MTTTDFAKTLTAFFTRYLAGTRNLSENTIKTYRDAFRQFLEFCKDERSIAAEKLTFSKITKQLILDFLSWIEQTRKCSISTCNQRLAALHSFFRFAQSEEPSIIQLAQDIISIRFKEYPKPVLTYLSPEHVKLLLRQPSMSTKSGRRNATLLSVLYDTGGRVQEICDILVKEVRLDSPAQITLKGKGRKVRFVPLMDNTASLLKRYIEENSLYDSGKETSPLFFNQQHEKLTRGGMTYILQKYAKLAHKIDPSLPETITPHILRHSKAMHLYQSGSNLVYVRDILGHVDISTTDIYARMDMNMKRAALEKAYPEIIPTEYSDWSKDDNLMTFLHSL